MRISVRLSDYLELRLGEYYDSHVQHRGMSLYGSMVLIFALKMAEHFKNMSQEDLAWAMVMGDLPNLSSVDDENLFELILDNFGPEVDGEDEDTLLADEDIRLAVEDFVKAYKEYYKLKKEMYGQRNV